MDLETINCMTMLEKLIDAIRKGDKDKVKEQNDWFHQNLERNTQLLKELHTSKSQGVTQTDLILAACRNKQADILYYILFETDILKYLPGADFDDTKVKTQRTEAFKQALILDDFTMVEMLYDYWIGRRSSASHRPRHDINKITTLGEMLDAARVVCAVENQQLLIDIHSLIKFNDFQKNLYSEISKIRPEEIVTLIETAVSIYDKYLDIEMFRLKSVDEELDRKIKACIEDKRSDYMKIQVYIKYERYYRKLDFNIALLILDNWFVLRKHFKDNADTYKEIEIALYHFIYRTCEDWRLYLPRDRQITIEEHHTGIHNGRIIKNLKITSDEHKLHNGPVLFLEHKSFNEHVRQLKTLSQTKEATEKNKLDDNYLFTDYYSLSKINFYLKAIENTDNISILMIERVLQVTGEMLKSTDESKHLSEDTKSFLQIAMSVETVNYLYDIRNFLSHAEEGQLSIRIDIANNRNQEFDDQDWKNTKQYLNTIKRIINEVLDIFKPILDKSLLEKGLRLIDKRIENLPHEAARHIVEIYRRYDIHGKVLIESEPLLQELVDETGLTIQLLKEIIWIRMNKDDISLKIQSAKTSIDKQIVSKLPTYIQNIRQTLQLIDENNRNVELINQQLQKWKLKKLPNNTEKKDINDRKGKVEKIKRQNKTADVDSLLRALNEIKCFSIHWEAINKILSFCYDECDLIGPKPQIVNDVPSVTKILDELDDKICRSISTCTHLVGKLTFNGTAIEKLHGIFEKHKTTEIAREKLISCLISRVNLLKEMLQFSHITQAENLLKYKRNHTFRFELEMVLADIANVFVACKIKGLMYKSDKLLKEIDLRNVLHHGNPFLDVFGDIFDSTRSDVATALLSKAIMFVEDRESIEALFELFKANIDFVTIIEEKLDNMNDQQKDDYKRFQKSPNWESYVYLILEKPKKRA